MSFVIFEVDGLFVANLGSGGSLSSGVPLGFVSNLLSLGVAKPCGRCCL